MIRLTLILVIALANPDAIRAQGWPCFPEQWFSVTAVVNGNRLDVTVTNVTGATQPPTQLAIWADAMGEMVHERITTVPALAPGASWHYSATVSECQAGDLVGYWQWLGYGYRYGLAAECPAGCDTHQMPALIYSQWFACAFNDSAANCDGSATGN